MNWLDTTPVVLACLGWLIIPGLLTSYAIGLRSIAAWAVAPILSVAIITVTAAVAGKLGVDWSVLLVIIASLAVAVVSAVAALLLRRRFAVVREADPRPVTVAAFAGLLPAIVLGAITVVWGMGNPDAVNQTFDAVFHYNAVAFILDTHNASALTLAAIGSPSVPTGFYPGAWHDFASLAVLSTGTTIPVAANLVTSVIAVIVWPLGCLLLVRQLTGRSAAAMAITAVVSIAFTAFPWGLMSFGVLWPNVLGLALLPGAVAISLSIAGLAKDDAIGRGHAWVLAPIVLVAAGFAHPNSVFSLVVITLFPLFTAIGRWTLRMRADGHTGRGLLGLAVAVAVVFAGWLFVATSPAFAVVRNFNWPPFETTSRAFGEAVLGATNGRASLWVLAAAVLVGIVLLWRQRDQRWLIGAFTASVFMYVLTASLNTPITKLITGYWYNDSYRLAAMLPITAVPLAVLGILAAVECVKAKLADGERPRLGRFGASTMGLTLVAALVVLAASKGGYLKAHVDTVAGSYARVANSNDYTLVDPREMAFYGKVKDLVPADSVIANNPWDGSAMIWALDGRKPLFPHLEITWSDQQRYLAKHLVDAATDPEACLDAKQLKVGYLIVGNLHFWPWEAKLKEYPGIVDPGNKRGFQLVASDQELKLYKLTAC